MRFFVQTTDSGAASMPHALAASCSPMPLWLVDAEGRCVWCNRAFMELTGWQPGESDFRPWWAEHVPEDDRGRVRQRIAEAKQALAPYEVEYRFRAPDGRYRWVLQRATPVLGAGGELRCYAGGTLDITSIREREDRLRETGRIQEEFLGLLSHELAGPLTAVLGFARRLSAGVSEPERMEAAWIILREAERLRGVIDQMQVLARAEQEAAGVEPHLLQHLLTRLAPVLSQRLGRAVQLRVASGMPTVLVNETWLDQILTNLTGNAAKYGSPEAPIEIEAQAGRDGEVVVTVLDRGPGISAAERERIFEPFYRSPANREGVEGAGLGLAVCRRLVELQHGRIWAGPREGGGTAIAFTLPTVPIEEAKDVLQEIGKEESRPG